VGRCHLWRSCSPMGKTAVTGPRRGSSQVQGVIAIAVVRSESSEREMAYGRQVQHALEADRNSKRHCALAAPERYPPAAMPGPRRLRRPPRRAAAPLVRGGTRCRAAPGGLDTRRRRGRARLTGVPRGEGLGKGGWESGGEISKRISNARRCHSLTRHTSVARTSPTSPHAMAWA